MGWVCRTHPCRLPAVIGVALSALTPAWWVWRSARVRTMLRPLTDLIAGMSCGWPKTSGTRSRRHRRRRCCTLSAGRTSSTRRYRVGTPSAMIQVPTRPKAGAQVAQIATIDVNQVSAIPVTSSNTTVVAVVRPASG